MKWFRNTLRKNRIFILTLLAINVFHMVEGEQFIYAHQVHQQKEDRLKEISELLDIPVEQLRPDHDPLFDSLRKVFGVEQDDAFKAAGLERLQTELRKHQEQVAANPYLPQVEAVKNEHQAHRIEGMIQDLMQLTDPGRGKALSETAQLALLRNLDHGLKERVLLPPLPAGLPAKARAKQATMQTKLDRMFDTVRPIVAASQQGESTLGTVAQKVEQMRLLQGVETKRAYRDARFVDRPLPLRRVERQVRTEEITAGRTSSISPSPSKSAGGSTPRRPDRTPNKAVAAELVELAAELENSPASIFRFVHDEIAYDPKWGSYTGSLGTLWARSGTSWDQALLLRDLLEAAGVDARLEWGEVEISTETLVNLAGVEDPIRAGDLLTTAGLPIVLYTQGSQVVGARLSHVWVRAHLDYIPNRGVTSGPGDTWVRMDPSFTRIDYAPGIRIHDQVPFALGDYLLNGTEQSPLRAYQDALWAHIRANDIACTTLEQLKPAASVRRESFPFVPGTLRAKILSVDGEATSIPAAYEETLDVVVRTADGASLLTWSASVPATYGQRLELGWRGATAEDQATLDTMGGVFETPPYLVDLVPVVLLDGVEQATGSLVGSAEEVEIAVTLEPANGPVDAFVHEGYAGEPGVLVTAFGPLPPRVVTHHQEALAAAQAAGDAAAIESATLQLLGTTYFRSLGHDAEEIAGWTWHRLLRLVSEGLVVQTGSVTMAVDGSPLTFTKGETFVDFPGFVVGLFHATGTPGLSRPTLELAGAQGSFLEGQVFDEVVVKEGIAAVSALTQARREGQDLARVDASNVDSVLASVDLGSEVEDQVRSAVEQQGRIAWVPEAPITRNVWSGVGYILEDPSTGAAGYLISGGFAGGVATEKVREEIEKIHGFFGSEPWFQSSYLGKLFRIYLGIFEPTESSGTGSIKSDPVHMAVGNFWQSVSDLTLTAHGHIVNWGRSYNSRSDYQGPFGHGWTFVYGVHLEARADGAQTYREADGTEHTFEVAADGSYLSPPGKNLELISTPDGFTMTSKYGEEKRFGPSGQLLAMSSLDDSFLELRYDAAGQLSEIVDPTGRTLLNITFSNGLITEVRDLSGREVLYTYQGGNLTGVRDPSGSDWQYGYDAEHNLISVIDPVGNQTQLAYDAADRCIRRVDARGGVERYFYSSEGKSAVFEDRIGASTYLEFDERGRAILEVDGLGNALQSSWDDANNRLSTTDSRGGLMSWTYDERGNVLSQIDPEDGRIEYTYGPRSEVLTFTDALGEVTTNTYDADGNLTHLRQDAGGEVYEEQVVYDPAGNMVEFIDALDRSSFFEWDPILGVQTKTTDAAGHETEILYDDLGRVSEFITANGESTVLEWNESNQVTRMVDPARGERLLTYDDLGRLETVSSSQGLMTLTYDEVGNPIRVGLPEGNEVRMEYDAGDRLIARVDARGFRTTYAYDSLGRRVAVVDPTGATWTFGHCAELGGAGDRLAGLEASGPCTETDPLGNTIERSYDRLGRVIEVRDAEGNTAQLTYDALGQRTEVVDAEGNSRQYEYDARGNLTAVVDEASGRTEYDYGLDDQIHTIRDAEGQEWTRTYDAVGRLESETDPLDRTHHYRYDATGQLIEVTTPDGTKVTYDYDQRRLASRTVGAAAPETYTYDPQGRLLTASNSEGVVSYQRDGRGRVLRETSSQFSQPVDYGYDLNGNLTSVLGPAGEITMSYDARDRLVEQVDPLAGRFGYEYDSLGRRSKLIYPNGVTANYVYDTRGFLTGLVVRNQADEVVDGFNYGYDARGYRTSAVSLASGIEEAFAYDPVGRLTSWNKGDHFESYSYDLVGNRLTLESDIGRKDFVYDAAHQLSSVVETVGGQVASTSTYQWDSNGSLAQKTVGASIETFGHDAIGRLLSHSQGGASTDFFYDALGRRTRRVADAQEERFLYRRTGGLDQILGVFDGSGARQGYFVSGARVDEVLAQVTDQVSYLHQDGLGSVRAVSGTAGSISARQSYRPFGARLDQGSSPISRFGFAGRESESENLMFNRARFYQPEEGRFIARDPVAGSALDPSSLHPYLYAFNSPTNFVDPTGFLPEIIEIGLDFFTRGLGTFIMLLSVSADTIASYDNLLLKNVSASQRNGAIGSLVNWFGKIVLLIGTAFTIYDTLSNPGDLTPRQAWVKIWVTIFLNTAAIYGLGLILISPKTKRPRFNFRGFVAAAVFFLLLANVFITMLVTAIVDELMYVLRFRYRVI